MAGLRTRPFRRITTSRIATWRIATRCSLAGVRPLAGSGTDPARSGVDQRARCRWSAGFRRWSWSRECGTDDTRSRFALVSDHGLGRTVASRRKMVGSPSPSVGSIPVGHREFRRAESLPGRDHRRNVVVDRRLHVILSRCRHRHRVHRRSWCRSRCRSRTSELRTCDVTSHPSKPDTRCHPQGETRHRGRSA